MQIIQHKLNTIEIKIALNENVKKTNPLRDELFSRIHVNLLQHLGSDVDLILNQVDDFDLKAPYVISKLGRKNWEGQEYLV